MMYNIRAELPENRYEDFQVGASDMINAQVVAEDRLMRKHNLGLNAMFDWRGLVVFVNQGFRVRV